MNRRLFLAGMLATACSPAAAHHKPNHRPTTTTTTSTTVPLTTTTSGLPLDEWPGPSNTGIPVGTSLTPSSGLLVTSSDGQVIQDLDHAGQISVEHNNVIVRRCKITAQTGDQGGAVIVWDHDVQNFLIEDCEINGGAVESICGIFSAWNTTARRLNIHNCENGLDLDGFSDIRDCWVHDLSFTGPDPHADACQIATNATNLVLHHNFLNALDTRATSAIITNTSIGHSDIHITGNKLWGGQATVYFPSNPSPRYYVNGNRFIKGVFFYTANDVSNITEFIGNVDDITGVTVVPDG